MAKKGKTITTYKGFDKDLKCRGFQYEIGKEYELSNGESVSVCSNGFHACESPLEVLDHYFMDGSANLSRFCEVEQSGEFSKEVDSTKVASSKIKIKKEITFADLINSGVEWLKEKNSNDGGGDSAIIASSDNCTQIGSCDDFAHIGSSCDYAKIGSSGDCAQIGSSGDFANIGSSSYRTQIGSSGYCAKIGSSGDTAKIGSSGDFAKIDSTGEESVIMCAGRDSAVKAKKGSWITLAEWYKDNSYGKMKPKYVKTEYVDGERIKEDTWYKLVDGEFIEA